MTSPALASSVARIRGGFPSLPMPVLFLVLALLIGFASDADTPTLIRMVNEGFGRALGEFALIFFPAFAIAECLRKKDLAAAAPAASVLAPLTGAAMICPDTSYASLAPMAGRRKLSVAFGSYAGFKLLFPAGPFIVATGLGLENLSVFVLGVCLLVPAWAAGEVWAMRFAPPPAPPSPGARPAGLLRPLVPFLVLFALLGAGAAFPSVQATALGFVLTPKGALLAAAVVAVAATDAGERAACLEAAARRTAGLLFVIGAAGAFGTLLAFTLPLEGAIAMVTGSSAILALFAVTALFKLVQGSSMATFAAVTPAVAPLVPSFALDPAVAVFAICLGSFVTIVPTDSFYWVVRRDALAHLPERRALWILGTTPLVQAGAALTALLAVSGLGILR